MALATHARAQLGLTQMVLMPAGTPPHKLGEADPGVEHRLRMCQLAIAAVPGLSVSALETEREGPSFTVDTLRSMKTSAPEARLTFLVGADTARTLPEWHEPGQLLDLADLAIAARAGTQRAEVLQALAAIDGESHATFVEMPSVDVSSSMVRELVAGSLPVQELVGDAVADYIATHGLYRRASGAGTP